MKLLIVTQAVDTGDKALGFFHRWIEVFAPQFETIEVVCLKEGAHALPANVHVHSLGKERGVSRLGYVFNFFRCTFSLQYDAVLVHMNEEYALLGGWWWRLCGKKVVLWRNHKMGSWKTRFAAHLSTVVCYTSPDAFVARYTKAVQMPIGIDTDFFVPPSTAPPASSILFLGRLDPVKKVELFIKALDAISAAFNADLYGSPTQPESSYAKQIAKQAQPLVAKGVLALHSGVPHEQTLGLYQSHALYVNLTPSGSFDKTIGEAMASGCMVVCANEAVRGIINPALLVRDGDAADVARGIDAAFKFSAQERAIEVQKLRAYVEQGHSLNFLIEKIKVLL